MQTAYDVALLLLLALVLLGGVYLVVQRVVRVRAHHKWRPAEMSELEWLGAEDLEDGYSRIWILHNVHVSARPLPEHVPPAATSRERLAHPGRNWDRLPWLDIAERTNIVPSFAGATPVFPAEEVRAYVHPRALHGPIHGSLDEETWYRIVEQLRYYSDDSTECFAYYAPDVDIENTGFLLRGQLKYGNALAQHPRAHGTPTFLWPLSRGWLLWTPPDAPATKLLGTGPLTERFLQDKNHSFLQSAGERWTYDFETGIWCESVKAP